MLNFKHQVAQGNDGQRRPRAAHRDALILTHSCFEAGVEVEEEFELMRAFAAELIFDRPIALALVEGDDAPVGDRLTQSRVGVMLCVEQIARGVALPQVHARADVFDEGEQRLFVEPADLFAVDAHRVVISGRAKAIAPARARRVDEAAGVAQECRAVGIEFKRQRV